MISRLPRPNVWPRLNAWPLLNAWTRLDILPGDRRAVTALEYGIIASILGLVLVTIFTNLGSTLKTLFTHVGASI